MLLRAARFTTGYVRLVGQEPAPSKCLPMSTSKTVQDDMRGWIVTDEGDKWSVKLVQGPWWTPGLVGYSGYAGPAGHCPVSPNICPSS